MKVNIGLLLILLIASISCEKDDEDKFTFHIAVGNQSNEIDPVDIKVLLDDIVVIEEKLQTLDAHNWKIYDIQAPGGVYTLSVNPGKVEHTEVEMTLDKERWVLINHYFPRANGNPDSNFMITISDEPFAFE